MKTAVITGATRGLGFELVKVFLDNGWDVIAGCRRSIDFPLEIGAKNLNLIEVDVSKHDSIDAFISAIGNRPIDLLINNAGIFDATSADDDNVIDTFDEITLVFQVNSIAPEVLAEGLLPNLLDGGNKTIITISSAMGTHAAMDSYHAEHWVYSASKAAVNYAMAAFGTTHPEITSVLINPGWMKTSMGGGGAPLNPNSSAQKIYTLFSEGKLQGRKLMNTEGEVQGF